MADSSVRYWKKRDARGTVLREVSAIGEENGVRLVQLRYVSNDRPIEMTDKKLNAEYEPCAAPIYRGQVGAVVQELKFHYTEQPPNAFVLSLPLQELLQRKGDDRRLLVCMSALKWLLEYDTDKLADLKEVEFNRYMRRRDRLSKELMPQIVQLIATLEMQQQVEEAHERNEP